MIIIKKQTYFTKKKNNFNKTITKQKKIINDKIN